jgi:hypothetical protein
MSTLQNALQELREKRDRAQSEVEKLNQVISGIESLNGLGVSHKATPSSRRVSAASRRKMALAQRARWASIRKESQPSAAAKTTDSAPVKRTMSASARRKIAAAQRARWKRLKGQAAAPKPKRHISAAGKKRIAAAARERWAQFRAAKKAA